jgi:adenosyl cobinamide kinase/adenosyl cobinamide phosphate guanylyltransferase
MIECIVGPPSGGKSEVAETRLAMTSGPHGYIGSLPNTPRYREKIQAHKRRRPPAWKLLELTGDPIEDLENVRLIFNHCESVLFDGLSFYILRLWYAGLSPSEWRGAFVSIIEEVEASSRLLLVVDAPAPPLSPANINGAIIDSHRILYRKCARISLVHNGLSEDLTIKSALRLELSRRHE